VDSYPPHLLRLPGTAPGSPARGATAEGRPATVTVADGGRQDAPPVLLAVPGSPGAYVPPVSPADRPRNITELVNRVTVATPEPWPAGAYLQIGESGRRAHWTGEGWKGGESPGYAAGELVAVRSEPEQTREDAQP